MLGHFASCSLGVSEHFDDLAGTQQAGEEVGQVYGIGSC